MFYLKTLLILSFIVINSSSIADEKDTNGFFGGTVLFSPKEWITINEPTYIYDSEKVKADSYQVITTKKYRAVKALEDKSFVKLSEDDATSYTGLTCYKTEGKFPYLVRGVSDNATSGEIATVWFPKLKSLSVVFFSMGSGGTYGFVPIIVYLPVDPLNIWVTTTGAL